MPKLSELAYAVGFLWADGCLTDSRGNWRVSADCKDEEPISVLEQCFGGRKYFRESRQIWSWYSSDYQLAQDLMGIGITRRKSLSDSIPRIRPELRSHFVRGLFDGDGNIDIHGHANCFTICGTQEVCDWLLNLTQRELKVRGGVYDTKHRVWVWRLNGLFQARRFRDWMYRGATVWLPRKKMVCDRLGGSTLL